MSLSATHAQTNTHDLRSHVAGVAWFKCLQCVSLSASHAQTVIHMI